MTYQGTFLTLLERSLWQSKYIQNLFEDVYPEENLQVFFEKYMPVVLEGVWTISLDE